MLDHTSHSFDVSFRRIYLKTWHLDYTISQNQKTPIYLTLADAIYQVNLSSDRHFTKAHKMKRAFLQKHLKHINSLETEYLQKPFLKEFRLHQDHSEDIFPTIKCIP